jgi:hypothetical protein
VSHQTPVGFRTLDHFYPVEIQPFEASINWSLHPSSCTHQRKEKPEKQQVRNPKTLFCLCKLLLLLWFPLGLVARIARRELLNSLFFSRKTENLALFHLCFRSARKEENAAAVFFHLFFSLFCVHVFDGIKKKKKRQRRKYKHKRKQGEDGGLSRKFSPSLFRSSKGKSKRKVKIRTKARTLEKDKKRN